MAAPGLNKLMLIGILGRDPEMRYTAVGEPVTTFSLATPRTQPPAEGEEREASDWFTVVVWRQLAEDCHARLAKGSQVYVEGRVQTRVWEDEDGKQHAVPEVVARKVLPLDQDT
jgi:single-strand DNA-binding protein